MPSLNSTSARLLLPSRYVLFALVGISFLAAVVVLLISSKAWALRSAIELFVAVLGLFVAVAGTILAYLQHSSGEAATAATKELRQFASRSAASTSQPELAQLSGSIERLSQQVMALSSPFTDEQRVALARAAADTVAATAVATKLEELAGRIGQDFDRSRMIETLERNSVLTLTRLNSAIPDLARRGNLNLAIGIATTLLSVTVLAFAAFTATHPQGASTLYFAELFPRLALAVLVEVFAYFFLRLYKENLESIRFLQNEMTNAEVARTALATVILAGDKDGVQRITIGMCVADRNRPYAVVPPASPELDSKPAFELLSQVVAAAKSAK